jgi:hypothetical protein
VAKQKQRTSWPADEVGDLTMGLGSAVNEEGLRTSPSARDKT